MTGVAAASLLDVSVRQVQRLLKTFQADGATALRHKARGWHSNNRIVDGVRDIVLELIREHYIDFGPTLAREKLIERHRLAVSKETLRKWMTEAGIWTSRRERKQRLHQPRGRRDCLGEMVQIDSSHHWWFENRGPKCALLRRFLLHVLPRGFHRIRHYGLLAGSARKTSLALARELLNVAAQPDDDTSGEPEDFRPACPCCGGRMIVIEVFERWRQPRGPPGATATNRESAP